MSDVDVTAEVTTPTLYVCHVDEKMPMFHPCAKANNALNKAGINHNKIVYGQGKPFGRGTEGTRPDIKEISGQEKLPVLVLPGGEVVSGGKQIINWAKNHAKG
ncbi:MAG: glutathione S-transferase N-terminal domain-containing protein [Solirubrobacterales bacterium]